jgi:tetratricopeptide (TPR) repeat protein
MSKNKHLKNKLKEINSSIEKINKIINTMMTTVSMDELWQTSELLLDGSLLGERIKNINKTGGKKFAFDLLTNFNLKNIDHQVDDDKESSDINYLSDVLKENFKNKDYGAIIADLFFLTINHILEVNDIKMPEKIQDLDFDKYIAPNISPDMTYAFSFFQSMVMGKIASKINSMNDGELDKLFALFMGVWIELQDIIMIESVLKHKNPKRKKQIEALFEKPSKVLDEYYDLMESNISDDKKEKKLMKLIEQDPDFFDLHQDLINIYNNQERYNESKLLLLASAKRAVDKIVDSQGRWPKQIMWAYLENRPIVRMLDSFAWDLWEEEKVDSALNLYRKLLKSNPGDNIGARYSILSILMGYYPGEADDMFQADRPGFVDAFKLMEWFEENASNFPEEFDWWFEEMKEQQDKEVPKINNFKIGRNEPCPCGSGKKYKKCCGA